MSGHVLSPEELQPRLEQVIAALESAGLKNRGDDDRTPGPAFTMRYGPKTPWKRDAADDEIARYYVDYYAAGNGYRPTSFRVMRPDCVILLP